MTNQHKKNRRSILIIFGLSIIPFCFAWYLSKNPSLVAKGTSNGELVIPVITTERVEMTGFDTFSSENIKELLGHWLLVNVIPNQDCNALCIDAIHKTKQLRLMLNKDLTRVRRLVLLFKESDPELAKNWWQNDTRLLHIKPTLSLVTKLEGIRKGAVADGMLFLIDPLGNIMMQYEAGFDPYEVKRDLKKLLRISQIG